MIPGAAHLSRILEDQDLKKALAEFFESQAEIEMLTSAELMAIDVPQTDTARKHACYGHAYREAMNRMREYARPK